MSTYARLIDMLSDQEWHDRSEVAALTHHPDLWLKELVVEGHLVVQTPDGATAVHLADGPPLAAV